MEELRTRTFRLLKPSCVEVGQLVLKYKTRRATSQELMIPLETLSILLQDRDVLLDEKLADYVFFPLSYIFREAKEVPVRALEVALACLRLLISRGWRDQISTEMSKQFLILLSFLAGGDPSQSRVNSINEELAIAAFETLASVAQATRNVGLGHQGSIEIEGFPVMGHAVSVMIDGFTKGTSVKVQMAAIYALSNTLRSIEDTEALKNVFPGIVSSLTKLLSGTGKPKPPTKVLATGLDTLEDILRTVLNDAKNQSGGKVRPETNGHAGNNWLEGTKYQVKMALAKIMSLRYHDRLEVRKALSQLCISVITSCRQSMSQSLTMLVETLIVLSATSDQDHGIKADFRGLLQTDPALAEILKAAFHDWSLALPRTMQSNDDICKRRLIDQIATTYSTFQMLGINVDLLTESLAHNLQASIATAVWNSPKQIIQFSSESTSDMTRSMQLARKTHSSLSFAPILFQEPGARTTLEGLQQLVGQLQAVSSSYGNLEQGILTSLRSTSSNEQLASLWLSLQLLSRDASNSAMLEQYIEPHAIQDSSSVLLDETYSFALSVLARSTFDSDNSTWSLQALSLEALALQAQVQRQDFRPELVEALYPILERLGSNNSALQEHAMTCLDIVSQACEYPSSAALIIDNADYLVNAISLKLNTFDISPQAPQVLVMMIRLCGAPLIPFLDDLVDSIFSILACYHGYPKLVESLFTVLNAIVEESSKGIPHLILDHRDSTTRPRPYTPTTFPELATFLRSRREAKEAPPLDPLPSSPPPPSPPNRPTTPAPDPDPADLDTLPPADPPAPKPSKRTTILTRITTLVPSHLSSPSPTLRTSLLSLLCTALPLLARDTDAFLPLAAQLYPYISTRLFFPSAPAFELVAAAGAMGALYHCAGDFLRTRTDEEWPRLEGLFRRVEGEMMEEIRAQKGRKGGMCWRAWDAVVGLVMALVRDVGVDEERGEDGVFEILGTYVGGARRESGSGEKHEKVKKGGEVVKREVRPEDVTSGERREEVRECLEGLNPDYLWLVQERGRVQRGGERLRKPSDVDGVQFRDLDYELYT